MKWAVAFLLLSGSVGAAAQLQWQGTDCRKYSEALRGGCQLAHSLIEQGNESGSLKQFGDRIATPMLKQAWAGASELLVGAALINTAPSGGDVKALYRVYNENPELLSYSEITFRKGRQQWEIHDWRDYLLNFSARDRMEELRQFDDTTVYGLQDRMQFRIFLRLYQKGQHKNAVDYFFRISESLQKTKVCQTILSSASVLAGDEAYEKVLEYLYKQYGHLPEYDYLCGEYHTVKENYQGAHEAFDRLYKRIGGDYMVGLVKVSLYELDGRCDQVYLQTADLLDRYADELELYFMPVQCMLNEQRYSDLLLLMELLEVKLNTELSPENFADFAGAEKFFASDVYLKARPGN